MLTTTKRISVILGLACFSWCPSLVASFSVVGVCTNSAKKFAAAPKNECAGSIRSTRWMAATEGEPEPTTRASSRQQHRRVPEWFASLFLSAVVAISAAAALPAASLAVSGGGLDYANLDITGQDFSKGNYKGKDFTQVIAKTTNFAGSNLQGCRFFKAYLVKANFEGSDLRGASLEDTSMDGANLKNAIASGAYFSTSILDTESVENADFTDAQFPLKAIPLLCDRPDLKGTNPSTGVDTRESVMCP